MKRFSLIIALLTIIGLSSKMNAQKWYFYESFDNVTVDATGSANVPEGFTLYNDDNVPFEGRPDLSYFDAAWKVIRGLDGEGRVSSPSLFKSTAQADRWLVTPAIALTDAKAPKLYFRAKADDENAPDGFVLKISTTTADKEAFKNIRSVREARATWVDYVFDLSEYAGMTVYLAFVQNTTNGLTISIDDIRVGELTDGLGAACNNAFAPLYMICTDTAYRIPFPVSATLQNWSKTPITSARLCARMNGANEDTITTQTFDTLSIGAAGEKSFFSQTFSFDFVPSDADENATIEIWFDRINGQDVATAHTFVPCFIAKETELPAQKLIFEIFSSAMCSNCGPWNKIFHRWDSLYGGNEADNADGFVVAKFQVDIPTTGDPLVNAETAARGAFYGINSAPYWTMNGRRFQLIGGEQSDQTRVKFLDSMAAFRRTVSPLDLQVKLQRNEDTLTVETKTAAKLPILGKYRLYIALAEDSIHMTTQQMSEENDYYNIVRKMLPDANGTAMTVPQPGDVFETLHTYTVSESPRFYGSLDRVGAVAYIQNTETREIIQAAFAACNGEWSKTGLWLNDSLTVVMMTPAKDTVGDTTAIEYIAREAVTDAMVYPNPVGETATLMFRPLTDSPLTVSILDLQGRRHARLTVAGGTETQSLNLPTASLPTGLYLVVIEGADGRTSIKLLKK